jgi:hypothetical protein
MRTFTIATAFIVAAFAGIAASPVSAHGGGGAPGCAFGQHWDGNSSSCVSNRTRAGASRYYQ